VIADDLNADGKADLVVANKDSANVSVLLNTTPVLCSPAFLTRVGGPVTGGGGGKVASDAAGNLHAASNFTGTADFGNNSVFTTSYGGRDCAIVSHDKDGVNRWGIHLGSIANDDCANLVVSAAGEVYVVGAMQGNDPFYFDATTSAPGGITRMFVASYSNGGVLRWSKTLGDGSALGVAIDPTGNVTVSGGINGSFDFGTGPLVGNGGKDGFLVSYTPAGTTRWARVWGATLNGLWFEDLATDAAGNIYLAGELGGANANLGGGVLAFNAANTSSALMAASFDRNGNHRWSRSFPGTGAAGYWGKGIAADGLGNVFLMADLTNSTDFGGGAVTHPAPGTEEFALVKLNAADGTWVTERTFFGGTLKWNGHGLAVDSSNNVYVSGSTPADIDLGAGPVAGGQFFAKYSPSLGHLDSQMGGAFNGFAESMTFGPTGEVYIYGAVGTTTNWGAGVTNWAADNYTYLARVR
jgi:hypothetical protein